MNKEKKENNENIEIKNSEVANENINNDLSEMNSKLEEQTKKTDEYYEYLQRTMAEFDNYKKRVSKDRELVYDNSVSDIVEKILPVIDNFDKAMSVETEDKNFKEGIQMIHTQLKDVLINLGVEEVGKVGEEFDPYLHEAVMSVQDETLGEKTIAEVFRKGYKLKETKVIRHAMVKVAN